MYANKERVNNIKLARTVDSIFALILVLFPFIHVNTGIDVADVGYNLLNFSSFPNMNQTWAVSTLIANMVGRALNLLPFGDTMIGMNVYSILISGAFVAGFYYFLRQYYSSLPVFLGLLIAQGFCWCPRVILYHYLSYYLFACGVMLLLTAIKKESHLLYYASGGVLALNVFVRFPNVVECLLIVTLLAYAIMEGKLVVKEILSCFAGFMVLLIMGVFFISAAFGGKAFPDMIQSLFGMTSEATSYTPVSMLKTMFGDYARYLLPLLPFLGIAILGAPFLMIIKKIYIRLGIIIAMGLAFGAAMRILYYFGYFNFNYTDYRSIYMWGTFLLMIALVLSVVGLFDRNMPMEHRVLGVAVLCIILITPIGSNNGLYTALNNLFFVAPFVIGELTGDFDKQIFEEFKQKESGKKKSWWFFLSFRAVGLMIMTMTLVSALLFGIVFLFHDESFIKGRFARVQDNPRLAGMRTNASNAEDLQEVNDYLTDHVLKGKKAICYGFIPGLIYFMEEESALSHSWPDLDSFPIAELEEDLKNLDESEEELPVFFYSGSFENLCELSLYKAENKKMAIFMRFLQKNGYREVLRNDRYVICLPADSR